MTKPILSNADRAIPTPPPSAKALVPDLVTPEKPWHGSAVSELDHWRKRALTAEEELRRVRQDVKIRFESK